MEVEITIELIFALVQAFLTAILGVILKDRVIPSRFIPIQNIVIGVVSALIAVYFNLYDNVPFAIFSCLVVSLGVGGAYDAIKTKKGE